MSRVPWNLAMSEDAEQVSSDWEAPPRTLSSEATQSSWDQALKWASELVQEVRLWQKSFVN